MKEDRDGFYFTVGLLVGVICTCFLLLLWHDLFGLAIKTKTRIKLDYEITVTDGVPDTTFIYHK